MLVCQQTVVKVLKEEKTYATAEIKWDRECLREGFSETSQDKLMRSKQNSNKTSKEKVVGKLALYGQNGRRSIKNHVISL